LLSFFRSGAISARCIKILAQIANKVYRDPSFHNVLAQISGKTEGKRNPVEEAMERWLRSAKTKTPGKQPVNDTAASIILGEKERVRAD
jgi:hypothetical protein